MWFTASGLLLLVGVHSYSDERRVVEKIPSDRYLTFSGSRSEDAFRAIPHYENHSRNRILSQCFRLEERTARRVECPQLQSKAWTKHFHESLLTRANPIGLSTTVRSILLSSASHSIPNVVSTSAPLLHVASPTSSETNEVPLFPTFYSTDLSLAPTTPSPSPTRYLLFLLPADVTKESSLLPSRSSVPSSFFISSYQNPGPQFSASTLTPSICPSSRAKTRYSKQGNLASRTSAHPTSAPTNITSSSSFPTASPTNNTTSSSFPNASPTNNTTSSSFPTASPTNNTTSSSFPTAFPANNTTSSSFPTASPSPVTTRPYTAPPTAPPTLGDISSSPVSSAPSTSSLAPTESSFGTPPKGVSGVDYWYFVSAYCTLYGVKELTDDVILSAQSAFRFALTDGMNERDSGRVQVLAERPDEVVKFLTLRSNVPHAVRVSEDPERDGISERNSTSDSGEASSDASINDSSNRRDDAGHSVGVDIHSWSPSLLIARNVVAAFNKLHNNSLLVIIPMHEQNVHSVTGISVRLTQRTITREGPLFDINGHLLSPMRLFFVIIGTIFLFSFVVFLLFHAKRHFIRHPDTSAFLRDRLEVVMGVLMPLGVALADFCSHWHHDFLSRRRRDGFRQAAQDDDHGSGDADDCTVEMSELCQQPSSSNSNSNDLKSSCYDTEDSIEYADADSEARLVGLVNIQLSGNSHEEEKFEHIDCDANSVEV